MDPNSIINGGGVPPGGLAHSPSLHSLGVLGLRPVLPPLSNPPSARPSLPPTPALSQRGGGEVAPTTPALSTRGFVVGPGEMPNGSGPFVNGGIHNISDDSILTGSMSGGYTKPMNGYHEPPQQMMSQQQQQFPLQPMGVPRSHVKLMPGRMGGAAPPPQQQRQQQQQPSRPQSRGPPQQQQQQQPSRPHSRAGGAQQQQQQPARPQSRASGRGRGGVVPFTAV